MPWTEADHIAEHARLALLANAHGHALRNVLSIVQRAVYCLYPDTTIFASSDREDRAYLDNLRNELDKIFDALIAAEIASTSPEEETA